MEKTKMLYITRREHFSASHILFNQNLDEKDNAELFGKCNSLHGHNYFLEVTFCGETDKKSGYMIDLKMLKKLINDEIISKVDHKNLNDIEMFRNVIPTTENIVLKFMEILNKKVTFPNAKLYSVKLYETEKNFVEIRND